MSLKPLRKEAMFLVVLAMVVSGAAGQGPTVFDLPYMSSTHSTNSCQKAEET